MSKKGKIKLEPMQPVICPLVVHDLFGGPQGTHSALLFHCTMCPIRLASNCGSFHTHNASEFLLGLLSLSFYLKVCFFAKTARNTNNSQTAAFDTLSLVPDSEINPLKSDPNVAHFQVFPLQS